MDDFRPPPFASGDIPGVSGCYVCSACCPKSNGDDVSSQFAYRILYFRFSKSLSLN